MSAASASPRLPPLCPALTACHKDVEGSTRLRQDVDMWSKVKQVNVSGNGLWMKNRQTGSIAALVMGLFWGRPKLKMNTSTIQYKKKSKTNVFALFNFSAACI
jgi:hypothetical protein